MLVSLYGIVTVDRDTDRVVIVSDKKRRIDVRVRYGYGVFIFFNDIIFMGFFNVVEVDVI